MTNNKIPEGWWQIPGSRGSNKEVAQADAKALQYQITHKRSHKFWDTLIDYDPNFRAKAFLGRFDIDNEDNIEETWLILVNTPKPIFGTNYSREEYEYRHKKTAKVKPKRKVVKKKGCGCK